MKEKLEQFHFEFMIQELRSIQSPQLVAKHSFALKINWGCTTTLNLRQKLTTYSAYLRGLVH